MFSILIKCILILVLILALNIVGVIVDVSGFLNYDGRSLMNWMVISLIQQLLPFDKMGLDIDV